MKNEGRLKGIVDEIRSHLGIWLMFIGVAILIYGFYYFFTPVYIYVVSSPYVGPAMINGFADAVSDNAHPLFPVKVVDFAVNNNYKDVVSFVRKVKSDIMDGKRVVALVGTDISSETELLLKAMQTYGLYLPVISQSSSSPHLKKLYPRFFRLIYNDEYAVSLFGQWYASKGPKKPVIVLVDKDNETWASAVAHVFKKSASSYVISVKSLDMNNPLSVRHTLDKVIEDIGVSPDDVYVFVVDYKLSNIYNLILATADRYKNFLLVDSSVKYMFTKWFPAGLNIYLYYLPVKDDSLTYDYDYDLAYDAMSIILDITKYRRTAGGVFSALRKANYDGITGHISFVYQDGIYERVFDGISILKDEGGIWHVQMRIKK